MSILGNPTAADMAYSITPILVCRDGLQAIEFYKAAFHAVEVRRLVAPNGYLVHASMRIGNCMLMLAGENADWQSLSPMSLGGSPVTIHLVVPDVDATVAQAAVAGATITMPVADVFWGDRYGQIVDPFGHRWSIATPKKNLSDEDMREAMMRAMPGLNA
jgi:PhnB protein